MFKTANNENIARGCLALNRRKVDNLVDIETGDSFESMKHIAGSSYGGVAMEGGARRKRTSRRREYETQAQMPVVSTLNSDRYLPIKRSGAFQTPVNVSQFYHDGGIQGAGQGEADIEKVEGGSRNVTSDLAGRMSELSGFGKPSMKKLLSRLKKRIRGGAWYDSLWSGLKSAVSTVADVLPKAIGVYNDNKDNIAKAGEYFNKAKDFLAPKQKVAGKGRSIDLDDNQLDRLAEEGKIEYNGSGIFSSMLGMMGLGRVDDGVSVKNQPELLLKGGYDMNIAKPLPVVAPIIDLRGNRRLPANTSSKLVPAGEEVIGGRHKRRGKGADVSMPPTIGSGMSKAKLRGLAIKQIMKDEGVKLGEASKILAERTRKHGSGFFDDLLSGIQKGIGTVAPLLPYIL